MSDFILPEDIERMARAAAQNIADGWKALERICVIKQFPIDIAHALVENNIANGLTEPEALRKIYHHVAGS